MNKMLAIILIVFSSNVLAIEKEVITLGNSLEKDGVKFSFDYIPVILEVADALASLIHPNHIVYLCS